MEALDGHPVDPQEEGGRGCASAGARAAACAAIFIVVVDRPIVDRTVAVAVAGAVARAVIFFVDRPVSVEDKPASDAGPDVAIDSDIVADIAVDVGCVDAPNPATDPNDRSDHRAPRAAPLSLDAADVSRRQRRRSAPRVLGPLRRRRWSAGLR
jgi:hypothetical protein